MPKYLIILKNIRTLNLFILFHYKKDILLLKGMSFFYTYFSFFFLAV